MRKLIVIVSATLLLIAACKKETPQPHNPYSDINYNDTSANNIPVDSLTVTYVHTRVFQSRCALPGCHDGNFEPDFRTPQSSFSTLVYANVIKNNADTDFVYRVIPFHKENSVLYERITNCCFVNQDDRMPQDNIGVPLPDSSIALIAKWIDNGARDMFGNVATLPNLMPTIEGVYYATNAAFNINYGDTRVDGIYYNPFILSDTVSSFYFIPIVSDDSTAPAQFQVNKLKVSTDPDDFSGAWEFSSFFINIPQLTGWIVTVNTAALPVNTVLYCRYYVNDGDHAQNAEFPRTDNLFAYKTFWSFVRVQ